MIVTGLEAVDLHPNYPEQAWIVVEQPPDEPYRIAYDPARKGFVRTPRKSLTYERGFSGAYGWIGGTGIPPEPHYDVLLLTRQPLAIGAVVLGYIIGFFQRGDGDHKFVAVDAHWKASLPELDLTSLDAESRAELQRLYPRTGENEGWQGAYEAHAYLKTNQPQHV